MSERRAAHDSRIQAALADNLLTGWAPQPPFELSPDELAPYAAKRRGALSAAFPGVALVIPCGVRKVRSNDSDYPFRAHSDFVWLSGDTAPDGVLVLRPVAGGHDAVLYVPPRTGRTSVQFFADRLAGELWVGRQPGPAEIAARLGVECRPLAELEAVLAGLGPARVHRGVDPRVDGWCAVGDPAADAELAVTLSELRLVKDDWEIGQLVAAADATARGFADVLSQRARAAAIVHGERWLEGTFWRRARTEGNDVGYSSIVACGQHATVLHWNRNDGAVGEDDLLLLDMGVEMRSLYTADVTRTVPVDGHFGADQRLLYDLVLAAAQAGMAAVRPGAHFLDPNRAAMQVLATGLHDWGILPVTPEEALSDDSTAPGAGLHRRYTLHNVSHMLGLDVHDCARARSETYLNGTLSPGMVLTVEPGLYFQPDDLTVPPELRGLGVRIEDDVAVTTEGARVLSDQLPREAVAVEEWLATLT